MLVLSRRNQQSIVIGGTAGFERLVKVTVIEIESGRVKLGFEGDADIPVHRLELWERMRAESELGGRGPGSKAKPARPA